MKNSRFLLSLLFIVLSLHFSGCQKAENPDGRLDVSGRITLNGGSFKDVDMSSIIFISVDNPEREIHSGRFDSKTGKYLLTRQSGLLPGKYKVRFGASSMYDIKTEKPVTGDTQDGDEYHVQFIPPQFGSESTIEFEVVAGKKNIFDYDIKGDLIFDDSAKKALSVSQRP